VAGGKLHNLSLIGNSLPTLTGAHSENSKPAKAQRFSALRNGIGLGSRDHLGAIVALKKSFAIV
jgi:hypothetical protein